MNRRIFMSSALCFGGQIMLLGSNARSMSQQCGDASCKADLMCQWDSAFDDDQAIDDRNTGLTQDEDDFPVWDGHPGINPDELKSPLAALGFYLKSRHFGDDSAENREKAYKILGYGQFMKIDRRFPERYYMRCIGGGEEDFWYCLTGLSNLAADVSSIEADIAWQIENNLGSVVRYFLIWCSQRGSPNKLLQMTAMYFLYLGQRHQDGRPAVKKYRSCFREKPDELFKLIAGRFKINPDKCS